MEKRQKNHAGKNFLNNLDPVKTKEKVTAVFEFNQTGNLVSVFLNAENERDQLVLERGIERLVKPSHLSWMKRLFG